MHSNSHPIHAHINLNDFDAAIFDMDGTMINNMDYHKKAWRAFAKKHGVEITDEEFKQKFSGQKNDKIFTGFFGRELSPEELEKYAEEKESIYRALYASEIKPVAGLVAILELLKSAGKKLAVATTAPKGNRDFGLKALGFENAFAVILGEEHAKQGKPHPEIYLETAKKLNVEPARCIVFEDSPPGVEAGKSAGMTVIALMTTHSEEDLQDADYTVKDFTEITFQ